MSQKEYTIAKRKTDNATGRLRGFWCRDTFSPNGISKKITIKAKIDRTPISLFGWNRRVLLSEVIPLG